MSSVNSIFTGETLVDTLYLYLEIILQLYFKAYIVPDEFFLAYMYLIGSKMTSLTETYLKRKRDKNTFSLKIASGVRKTRNRPGTGPEHSRNSPEHLQTNRSSPGTLLITKIRLKKIQNQKLLKFHQRINKYLSSVTRKPRLG